MLMKDCKIAMKNLNCEVEKMEDFFEKKWFIGKKIKDIYVDGSMVELTLEDNTKLEYSASDGGYSSYEIERGVSK